MMNQEIKTEWVAALRSGEYAQADGYLHAQDHGGGERFCCLGVLCDILKKKGLYTPTITVNSSEIEDSDVVQYDEEMAVLPHRVQELAGLKSNNPSVTYESEETGIYSNTLAEFNDDGMGFADLADLIEQQL